MWILFESNFARNSPQRRLLVNRVISREIFFCQQSPLMVICCSMGKYLFTASACYINFYIGYICKSHFKRDTNERPLSHQWTLPFLSHNFSSIYICAHTYFCISLSHSLAAKEYVGHRIIYQLVFHIIDRYIFVLIILFSFNFFSLKKYF